MKTKISAFVDGELESREATGVIEALVRDASSRETWQAYHLISDALRDTALRCEGFSSRFAKRLSTEPTVLLPGRLPAERRRWVALSAAASVAAITLVGWLAFAPAPEIRPALHAGAPLANAPRPAGGVQTASTQGLHPLARQAVAVQREASVVPLPRVSPAWLANDYLLAHQEFSPGMSLQGMAPFVRTVSGPFSEGLRR